jgi:hypothetical protein
MLQASKSYPGLEGCTYISYLDKVTTKCHVHICNAQGAKVGWDGNPEDVFLVMCDPPMNEL